jgi:hypothetical protein
MLASNFSYLNGAYVVPGIKTSYWDQRILHAELDQVGAGVGGSPLV